MSQHLLKEKMQSVAATGAEVIVAPNPGCMLQLLTVPDAMVLM
jgi:Fe-S oxidoreductase